EQGADVRTFARHVGQLHPGLVERATRDVERAVGALDGADAVGVEPAALEAFAVDPARPAVAFLRDHYERRHVAVDERAHADEGVRADPAELVDADEAAEDHVVPDLDVAGQRGVVGEHAMVADHAVMGDVGVGQQPVVVADAGAATAGTGTTVDRDELADGVAVADGQFDPLAAVLLVLRVAAERGVAEDAVVASDAGRAVDAAVRPHHRAVADLHFGADVAEGTHAHAGSQPGTRLDDGARMDDGLAHTSLTTSAQRMSAQATCSPSTRAMPW